MRSSLRWLTAAVLALALTVGARTPVAQGDGLTVLRVPDQYSSIQAAVDGAQPGDTIHVSAGVYNENVLIAKSGLRLKAVQGAVIDGTGLSGIGVRIGTPTQGVSDVEVSGFEVRNFEQGFVIQLSSGVRIHRNDVHHNVDKVAPLIEPEAVGIVLFGVRFSEVSGNRVYQNGAGGIHLRGLVGSQYNVVRANTVNENGSQRTAGWIGNGILLTSPSDQNAILENEVLDNSGWGIVLTRPPGQPLTGNVVAQNRVHGNKRAGIALMGSAVSGNLVLQNNATGNSAAGLKTAPCYPYDLFDQFTVDNTWHANHGYSNF